MSVCVLVLLCIEYKDMHSSSKVRTFWLVLKTSKACFRVKCGFFRLCVALGVIHEVSYT